MSGKATTSFPLPSRRPYAIGVRPQWLADAAVLAASAGIIGLFAVSPLTLEHFGMNYVTSGGGAFAKFHPSTFLCALALGLRCMAARRPLHTAARLAMSDPGVVLLTLAFAIACGYAIVVSKTPFTPLVDTFVLPAMCFLLLRDLDEAIARKLALAIILVLSANAIIAVYEMMAKTHVVSLPVVAGVSADPTRSDSVFDWRAELMLDWRATALLGHPLVNGMIVGCFIVALAAPGSAWLPGVARWGLGAMQLASMFAFGARTSLVLTLALVVLVLARQSFEAVGAGHRLSYRALAAALAVVALAIGALAILNETGFFDRTIERFADDAGSARTRLTMLELFHPFAWSDLMLGPEPDVVATWQRLYGLEFGIESSWVGLILTYGIVVFSMIAIALLVFSRSVVRACGRGAVLILVFYFVSVSGSASMSGKTTTFAMTVSLVMLMLRHGAPRLASTDPRQDTTA